MNGNKQGKRPEKNIKVGGVRAAIWKWDNTTKFGRTFPQYKVVLDRAYRDEKGEWKNTNSYAANDVPKAILALSKAYEYLHSNGKGDAEEDAPDVTEEVIH